MPHNPCNRWPHRPRICPARPCALQTVCYPSLQLPDPLTALIDLADAATFGTPDQAAEAVLHTWALGRCLIQ